jgi:hypothetical protein
MLSYGAVRGLWDFLLKAQIKQSEENATIQNHLNLEIQQHSYRERSGFTSRYPYDCLRFSAPLASDQDIYANLSTCRSGLWHED